MEFSAIRHYLGKSQTEIARLLGVSPKAIQSFEQGWRNIPPHCERQLLFLLYLKNASQKSVEPCWDVKQCDSQIRNQCVAWQSRAGHLCWFINGTICEGQVQENWDKKMALCRRCDVFGSLFSGLNLILRT